MQQTPRITTQQHQSRDDKQYHEKLQHVVRRGGYNAATKYFIAATPTFIVLDQEKKIVGKYSSLQQVVK